MQLIDGKKVSEEIRNRIQIETAQWMNAGGKKPHLCAILVGNDGASETYVQSKVKDCEAIGFTSSLIRFNDSVSEQELLNAIQQVNDDKDIDQTYFCG
jgi:methylenetetrahydrofolate dehydrogenase (NADP+)/methenyltetrahydrofolate cyclohydrolase